MRQPFLPTFVLAAALLASGAAQAAKPEDVTPAELQLAPTYCKDTMGFGYGDAYHNTSPRAKHWLALMGDTFWAMHHYCWAIINLARAERATTPASERDYLRKGAVADIRYVLSNVKPSFILLPEVNTRLGTTYLLLRDERRAEAAFKAAIKAAPDYAPAYARWAEYLIFRGNAKEAARQTVKEGLANAPESRTLKELWKELGGGPLPPPVVKNSPEESGETAAQSEDAATPADAEPQPATEATAMPPG